MEDNRQLIRATTEWMARKYWEMNEWLFNGALGDCKFEIFTTGKGSQGKTLGWFCVNANKNRKLRYDRRTRRMYSTDEWGYDKVYVNRDNFVKLCNPTIKLNGNYSGTEFSLLSTLVHEMCHYYNYMDGFVPVQGHGVDFRNIASIVSSRSNGVFTIERVASAEEMKGYELDAKFKEKREKRLANKKSKITLLIVYMKDGTVQLTNASNPELVDYIIGVHNRRKDANKFLVSNDVNLVELVFNQGYKKAQRTFRYYPIADKILLDAFENKEGQYDIDEQQILRAA